MAAKKTATRSKAKQATNGTAADISKCVEIRNVCTLDSQTHRDVDLPKAMDVTYETTARTFTDTKQSLVVVHAQFAMWACASGSEEEKRVVRIELVLELTYHCPGVAGFGQKALTQFGHTNGIYNAWPYWREFVQSSVARMGLPGLIVPVFRLKLAAKKKRPKKEGRRKSARASTGKPIRKKVTKS